MYDNQKINKNLVVTDSVSVLLGKSKDKSLIESQRKFFLGKALAEIRKIDNDSISRRKLPLIAYRYLKLKDTVTFFNINKEVLIKANRQKDSFAIADVHWNYASYYVGKNTYDSAYYHFNIARKNFKNNSYPKGRVLIGMANIRARFGDQIESEELIVEAIQVFKKLNDNKQLSNCYNHIGVVQKELEDYDKALFYYRKALDYSKKTNIKSVNEINIYNNIGIVYRKKKEYNKAVDHFKRGLNESNLKKYARVLDNIAYTRLLNKDTLNVYRELIESLKIRDSLDDKSGKVINQIHLSEYYLFAKDSILSLKYATQANILARQIKNSRDYLKSLNLIIQLDKEKATQNLKHYVRYSDSLQKVQREYQNKFARISHETDEYIEETNFLKNRQKWLIALGTGLIMIISLLYRLRLQKSRNEKLVLESNQQKLNEELYLLALKRQSRLEEEKIKERNRISENLHDSVLTRLFGVRMSFDFLEFKADKKVKNKYNSLIRELQGVEKEIRNLSHELSQDDGSSLINFESLLIQLIKNKQKISNIDFQLNSDSEIIWKDIDDLIKVNLYSILQEVFQNIIKHSNAKKAVTVINFVDNTLIITVKDDGVGFNTRKNYKGIGFKNLKSRAKKIGGTIEILSKINKGTSIKISIPLN